MYEIIKPNFKHYTRVQKIKASEAKFILAYIELQEQNFTDITTYNEMLRVEMQNATAVLVQAFESNLGYTYTDTPYVYDEYRQRVYFFDSIWINVVEFCTWALKLDYNLPDVLTKLVRVPGDEKSEENKDVVGSLITVEKLDWEELENIESSENDSVEHPQVEVVAFQEPPKKHKKTTKPPEALTEAIEYVYKILYEEGNTEILRPKSLYEFLKRLKEFAEEKGNRNHHTYVAERIAEVNPLEKYNAVITKERVVKKLEKGTITEDKRKFSQQSVSRRLCDLRKKYPLPS